jgi:hypothetical protein
MRGRGNAFTNNLVFNMTQKFKNHEITKKSNAKAKAKR